MAKGWARWEPWGDLRRYGGRYAYLDGRVDAPHCRRRGGWVGVYDRADAHRAVNGPVWQGFVAARADDRAMLERGDMSRGEGLEVASCGVQRYARWHSIWPRVMCSWLVVEGGWWLAGCAPGSSDMRGGCGVQSMRLTQGRRLVLEGCRVPHRGRRSHRSCVLEPNRLLMACLVVARGGGVRLAGVAGVLMRRCA